MARSLAELLHGGPVTAEEVERISDTLIFEQGRPGPKFLRFAILLVLASAIASFGLLGDSVAAVIGAMIVAPLMLPIMGMAFSISLGDRPRILNTLLVSLAGIAMAVAVGYGLTLPVAGLMHPRQIPQIMVRTAPHLIDLMAALATGVAGAFALSRRDVSDTLPGVAIAVSLVPPLANVGILLACGEPSLASGSLLLFITNDVAILLMGALVFSLMGFRQVATSPSDPRARRRALSVAFAGLLLIAIPLTLTSQRLIVTNQLAVRSEGLVRQWLEGSGYRLQSVDAETADGGIQVLLAGSGPLPRLETLRDQAEGRLSGRQLEIKVLEGSSLSLSTGRP
ncbi:MAG: DUF389 domain-containing protein [Cyanobium sp.]